MKYIVEAGAGQLAPPAVAVVDIADLALQPDTDRDINPDRELFLFDNAMDVARKVGSVGPAALAEPQPLLE